MTPSAKYTAHMEQCPSLKKHAAALYKCCHPELTAAGNRIYSGRSLPYGDGLKKKYGTIPCFYAKARMKVIFYRPLTAIKQLNFPGALFPVKALAEAVLKNQSLQEALEELQKEGIPG